MKLALIRPILLLRKIPNPSDVHLALAHLIVESPTYRDYHREVLNKGDLVILDNGAWETRGEEVPNSVVVDRLLRAYEQLIIENPPGTVEVVLPDVLGEPTETYERILEAQQKVLPKLREEDRIVVTPQATDTSGWVRHLVVLKETFLNTPITIGIPRMVEAFWGGVPLCATVAHLICPDSPIHLFGMGRDARQYRGLGNLRFIRSIDTTKPVKFAMYGEQYVPGYNHPKRRPKGYFYAAPGGLSLQIVHQGVNNLLRHLHADEEPLIRLAREVLLDEVYGVSTTRESESSGVRTEES